MTTTLGWLLIVLAGSFTNKVIGGETCQDPDRLIVCHIETELHPSTDACSCTHLVIHKPHDSEVIKAAGKLREKNHRLKILSLSEEGKKRTLEDGVSGVYLRLSKSLSKEQVIKNVKALATEMDNLQASKRANAKYSSENPETSSKDIAEIILELPSSPEQLAKNYDLRSLNKYVNYFIISSDNLTDSSEEGLAYHPSRLMGIDDILNADSLVDLISGLGAEHEKLLLSLPATALKFNLKDPKDNMPRAKVTGPPESISQKELCSLIENGVWTLERDEDLTAPYAYSSSTWLAFDDSVSAAIKAKYILLRGLAGIAVTKSEADDWGHVCASRPILDTIYSTFTNLVRKPRAATLLSLQDQIHNSIAPFAGDIQLSPYRIVRVVDRAGSVHVVRKEAKTEFQCSRQGYFTHPSGCNRFYRCVKFNQYSSDFTVFEYDCPTGLAFDERYEVCVWPGSLPDASACKGSSEIAPVPRSRYACSAQGYFADPENCRWFFACLDHHGDGTAPTAYEFRCPFGLVFNEKTLTCDWPWSVPGCGGGTGSVIHTSSIYPGDILEGRLRPAYAQVSDLHVSGGRIADVDGGLVLGTNLLSGISTSGQRYSNGFGYGLANQINSAFGNAKYEDNSGAYIHDPTGDTGGEYVHEEGPQGPHGPGSLYSAGHGSYGISSSIATGNGGQYLHDARGDNAGKYIHSEGSLGTGSYSSSGATVGNYGGGKVLVSGGSGLDNSGAYVHDSRGDNAGQYVHSEGSQGLYSSSGGTGGYYGGGKVLVSGGLGLDNSGAYVHDSRGDNAGQYVHSEGSKGLYSSSGAIVGNYGGGKVLVSGGSGLDNSATYVHDSRGDNAGQYVHSEGSQGTGSYSSSGATVGNYGGGKVLVSGGSGLDNSGAYVHDSRGDNAGQYVHSEGSLATGSYSSSGATGGYYGGGKVLVSGGSALDNSGAYVHDSRGDNSGQYVHSEGSQGLYSSSGATGGYYGGGKVLISGGSGQDNSGAYIHDSRGDTGGAYVHQEGPEGPGSKPYQHSGSSSIQYGNVDSQLNAYEHDYRGETGGAYVHQIGTSGPSSVIYSGIKSSGSDFSGASGSQLTADFHQSQVNNGQAFFGSKTANTLSSGAYIHDSRGDSGGAYVHQEGTSGPGSIPYIEQQGSFKDHNLVNGVVKTSHGYSTENIHLGAGGFTGGSYSSDSGQYIHDSTGDKGGDYRHQEGPSGPGPVPYVHKEGTSGESSLIGGLNVKTGNGQGDTTNYGGQNIVGVGGFTAGFHSSTSNSGQYIHDSRGDTGGEYVHQEGPSYHQGLYAGRYSGHYIHDNSGSYLQGNSGYYTQPYVHREGPSRPLYQGVNIYNSQYGGQYASKYATDQKHLIHFSNTNIDGAHLYQPEEGVIHTYDSSRLHVQPVGYRGSVLKPVTITKFSGIPLNPVQYSLPVANIHPVSVTTASPTILTEIKSHKIQPITVTEKPIVPLNPVQYITPQNGVKTNNLESLSLIKGSQEISHSYISPTTHTKTISFNPVQYNQESTVNTGFSGYEYSKPKITFSYPEHVVKHQYAVQPTPISHLTGYSYHPSVPVQSVNTVISQPFVKTNVLSPVFVSSTPRPELVSYKEPAIDTHIARPVSVTSSPVVPLNALPYGTKVETIQVSTPAPPTLISSHSYNPVIKAQTVRPIIVSSTPAVPLSPVQYGTKFQTFEGSTPAPPLVSSHSYNPVIKTQTVHPVIISSTPAVPLNPVQYGIKTISSSVGYHYSKPIVGLSYPKGVYSTQAPPVISYTYQKPQIKTQPIHPVVSTPALPDVSISHEIPIQQISNPPAFSYSYKQPIKPVIPVSISTHAPPVVSYSYQQPIKPVLPIAVSTPAPPVVSYSYQQPVKPVIPVAVSTPAPPVVSYSTTPRPIIVSSTPTVPLNPVQYVNPVSISTPAPPTFGYSYSKPIKPFVPVSISTPSPPVVSYSYQQPIKPAVNIAVSTPAPPVVSYSYNQPIKPVAISTHARPVISYSTTPRPIIVSSTPSIPLNPVQYVNPISTPVQPAFGYSYKQPIKPLLPIAVSTPAPPVVSYSYQQPIKPVIPVSVSTHAPPVVSYSHQQPIKPIVPIAVSTPAPPVVSYSYQQPVKPVIPVAVSTPAPPVVSYSTTPRPIIVSSTPTVPLNPVQYINPVSTPAPPTFGYSYNKPIKPFIPASISNPSPPVVSYSYKQPVKPVFISTPAPPIISYSTTPRPIIVSSTPSVPLNPVQYVNPISTPVHSTFGYSYERPIKPVSISTPAPTVVSYKQPIVPISFNAPSQPAFEYSYKRPIKPAVSISVTTPAPPVVSYSTTLRPVTPVAVSSRPVVPLNPVQYINPISVSTPVQPAVGYSYKQPLKPVIPVSVSTPAPPVVSYSYQQPIKPIVPIRVSTPAPPVVGYSSTVRPVQPIVVSSTPAVPLNPVQYFNPVPAQPVSGYSYKQPFKPVSFNIPVSTSAPPSVSYSYKQQVPVSTPAPPAVEFSYQQSVKPVYSPEVRYQTPLKPVAPIVNYSYQNPTTPAPSVIVSTPVPFTSHSLPVHHVKQVNPPVSPINIYSYKQPLAPSFTYSQPAPFSTSGPAILNYSYHNKGVQSISVSSTPTVPLNPVQYVKQVTTPTPIVSYSYKRPIDQSAVNKATNIVFSYTFDSKPVRPVTVSSTPAIPLNPVQYSVTPAPTVTYRPVSTYSTPSVPVINYSYHQPSLKPAVVTTHAPEVGYSYREEPDYFLKLKTVRPVSVTSTPAVPLNPIQYVSTTPRPIIKYQYQNPIIKTHTSVVAPSVDHYDEEVLHRDITKIQPKPAVGSFYEAPTRTTTLAPITVSTTPVVPLNPVQYVKHSQPVFSYTYNYAKPVSYGTKGCCSSPSFTVSSTPKPSVLKTTSYPSTIISTKRPVVGAYFEENYEANRQEEGYVYSQPKIRLEETPIIKGIYSTPPPYNYPSKVTTSTYLHRPVQTFANTVEEESYISNTPEHVTTLVKQPISVDTGDEDLNLHLDIPKIGVSRPIYTTTNAPQQQIVEVTTVTPVVKRVKVKGGLTRGGYYVRRQKVKVQPVLTTTENYPAYFTSTIKPIYSSTIDLSSPTLYSTTVRPSTVYTTSSSTLKDDELEVEDQDYDAKLLEEVSGQFGEIINSGNQGIIRQGFSTTTVSSLKDGETIVGVVKKERVAGGRNKAKVVVVSKLSDFNPLLVGKLGAECSCKSNSKTLNLQRGSSGTRGQLFYPEVQNARVPSREYLPTSSEPPKVNDYYLPASEVPYINAKASTTEASNIYDDQSYVEIRPINKVQKFYPSTGPSIDTVSTEYDTTTKRSISVNKVGISQEKTLEKGASFDRYGPGGLRGSDETLQGSVDCQRAGLFRHPKYCNKFYACNWDQWKKRFTLHVFNCPIHLAYDSQLGACNWPSKGPACADDNLLV
ncbi:uncharacterized protein [Halyomorpha halys]|uniref:uncharacterized protein n=1 Tax=Halyomorpha halys TaxID=286706 RepID=UPI0006D4D8A7